MTIKITQICDKCGRTRELKLLGRGSAENIREASQQGGWRELMNKDVCSDCISQFMTWGEDRNATLST